MQPGYNIRQRSKQNNHGCLTLSDFAFVQDNNLIGFLIVDSRERHDWRFRPFHHVINRFTLNQLFSSVSTEEGGLIPNDYFLIVNHCSKQNEISWSWPTRKALRSLPWHYNPNRWQSLELNRFAACQIWRIHHLLSRMSGCPAWYCINAIRKQEDVLK